MRERMRESERVKRSVKESLPGANGSKIIHHGNNKISLMKSQINYIILFHLRCECLSSLSVPNVNDPLLCCILQKTILVIEFCCTSIIICMSLGLLSNMI